MFTASDVPSLAESLSRWEWGEYISEAFVIVACAGELVAALARKCLTRAHRDRLERLSTILLVAALSASLMCLIRTNQLSGTVIGSLGEKADEADKKAKAALTDSATALTQSGVAETSSSQAVDESGKAETASSNALKLASEARREADSFEKDIVSAKEKAAKAEERTLAAEQALIQLGEKVQARHLSEKQKQDLIQRLLKLPRTTFGVMWANDAMDGQIYGEDFIEVLTKLGWSPGSRTGGVEWFTTHISGVFVVVHDPTDSVLPQAKAVGEALIEVGVPARPWVDSNVSEHSFELRIGGKE